MDFFRITNTAEWQIQDTLKLLLFGAIAILGIISAVYVSISESFFGGIFFMAVPAVTGLLFLNAYKGYYLENGSLHFPGGGIKAKSFSDLFKLDYYLQAFKRYSIRLDEINYIEIDKRKKSLRITGNFGAIEIHFFLWTIC